MVDGEDYDDTMDNDIMDDNLIFDNLIENMQDVVNDSDHDNTFVLQNLMLLLNGTLNIEVNDVDLIDDVDSVIEFEEEIPIQEDVIEEQKPVIIQEDVIEVQKPVIIQEDVIEVQKPVIIQEDVIEVQTPVIIQELEEIPGVEEAPMADLNVVPVLDLEFPEQPVLDGEASDVVIPENASIPSIPMPIELIGVNENLGPDNLNFLNMSEWWENDDFNVHRLDIDAYKNNIPYSGWMFYVSNNLNTLICVEPGGESVSWKWVNWDENNDYWIDDPGETILEIVRTGQTEIFITITFGDKVYESTEDHTGNSLFYTGNFINLTPATSIVEPEVDTDQMLDEIVEESSGAFSLSNINLLQSGINQIIENYLEWQVNNMNQISYYINDIIDIWFEYYDIETNTYGCRVYYWVSEPNDLYLSTSNGMWLFYADENVWEYQGFDSKSGENVPLMEDAQTHILIYTGWNIIYQKITKISKQYYPYYKKKYSKPSQNRLYL